MTARRSGPFPELLEDYLAPASPDLVRQMLTTFANALVSAEAQDQCNAEYREVSPERVNRGNGYRRREWDTRAGTVELAMPRLREGSYIAVAETDTPVLLKAVEGEGEGRASERVRALYLAARRTAPLKGYGGNRLQQPLAQANRVEDVESSRRRQPGMTVSTGRLWSHEVGPEPAQTRH
ncbi:transposase [Streptomyces sp. NPDC059928]|uniref:transposase n=1 Tax=unclassified Streptomyces TaxID=2593676 RepID=UPI00365E421E